MSTRSAIIRKVEDSRYEGIYCHFDGYLSGVGADLFNHYQDEKKVAELIALGFISSLGKDISTELPHTFENRFEGVVTAYGRDRGDKKCKAIIGRTAREVEDKIGHNGYVYVFEDGKWLCNGTPLTAKRVKSKE